MTGKFKVGDKVRVLPAYGGTTFPGMEGVVISASGTYGVKGVANTGARVPQTYAFVEAHLELVEEMKFPCYVRTETAADSEYLQRLAFAKGYGWPLSDPRRIQSYHPGQRWLTFDGDKIIRWSHVEDNSVTSPIVPFDVAVAYFRKKEEVKSVAVVFAGHTWYARNDGKDVVLEHWEYDLDRVEGESCDRSATLTELSAVLGAFEVLAKAEVSEYPLSIGDENEGDEWEINDDLPIAFGCNKGTLGELRNAVKIASAIKSK